MADPSPVIGLPNAEFIELKNNTDKAIWLRNWKIGDESGISTISIDFALQPDSFVIICSNSAVAQFAVLGRSIGVSNFPSLNNDGEVLTLYSPEGSVIYAVDYSADWYRDDVKREGGWSLEMIDTRNPCGGMNNWKASIDERGGTPGRKNSVDAINIDELPPALIRTYTIDSVTVVAVFDEPLDSLTAASFSNYSMNKNIGQPISASPVSPLYREVILKFPLPIAVNTVYELSVTNISDCAGNVVGVFNKAGAGLPTIPKNFDIIINEILFNPPPGGYDYIELYNRSNKVIDLQKINVCNINSTGNQSNIRAVIDKPTLFFPGEYLIITENANWLLHQYLLRNVNNIFQLPALPSLPDDKGRIAIIDAQGNNIDDLAYDNKWHFALISNEEGVSLERINYNDSTQNKNNWTSAASTVNFGTPGYQNSQFRADLRVQGEITINPKIFSPDNSGIDDFITIHCRFTEPGYVTNITIFDVQGRIVRQLVRNATMGISASFNWDGLDNDQKKLPSGHYIILTEIFNLQGKTRKFKNVVTLASGI
jgi:hypothetical protein